MYKHAQTRTPGQAPGEELFQDNSALEGMRRWLLGTPMLLVIADDNDQPLTFYCLNGL